MSNDYSLHCLKCKQHLELGCNPTDEEYIEFVYQHTIHGHLITSLRNEDYLSCSDGMTDVEDKAYEIGRKLINENRPIWERREDGVSF
jgi:hypothetical protein